MLEFEFWVERALQAHTDYQNPVPSVVFALRELAAERAERADARATLASAKDGPAVIAAYKAERGPVSYSHWGMHA